MWGRRPAKGYCGSEEAQVVSGKGVVGKVTRTSGQTTWEAKEVWEGHGWGRVLRSRPTALRGGWRHWEAVLVSFLCGGV